MNLCSAANYLKFSQIRRSLWKENNHLSIIDGKLMFIKAGEMNDTIIDRFGIMHWRNDTEFEFSPTLEDLLADDWEIFHV